MTRCKVPNETHTHNAISKENLSYNQNQIIKTHNMCHINLQPGTLQKHMDDETPKFGKPNSRFTRINTNPKVQIKTYKTSTNTPIIANPYHYKNRDNSYINPNRAYKQNNKICPTNSSFHQEIRQKERKSDNLNRNQFQEESKTQSSQTKLKTSKA